MPGFPEGAEQWTKVPAIVKIYVKIFMATSSCPSKSPFYGASATDPPGGLIHNRNCDP